MKKLILGILIAMSLVSCTKNVHVEEIELTHWPKVKNMITDGNFMFNLVQVDGEYTIEKYTIEGSYIDTHIIDINDEIDSNYLSSSDFSLFYNEDVFGVYYSYSVENSIYIEYLNEDLSTKNLFTLTYSDLATSIGHESIYFTKNHIYLGNELELVKYTINNDSVSEDKSISTDYVRISELIVADDVYLLLDIEDNEFSIGEDTYTSSTNQVLLKLSDNLEYIASTSINDSIEANGLKYHDNIFLYGKTASKSIISEYDESCMLINSIEMNLAGDGFIYGVNGIQFRDDNIYAVLEDLHSVVSIYNVDMENQSIEEVFTKTFQFLFANLDNINVISDEFVFVINRGTLFIIK
jgi:hypothetical protein